MTGEKCRHCGGRIEYIEANPTPGHPFLDGFWAHIESAYTNSGHLAAPAFGGGS